MLEDGRLKTLDLLKNELEAYFKTTEPDELKFLNDPVIKKKKLVEIINKIVLSVKFPEVNKLLENISLSELFYDLTWNDFKDDKLHREFREKEIMSSDDIDSIVNLKDAYETKK